MILPPAEASDFNYVATIKKVAKGELRTAQSGFRILESWDLPAPYQLPMHWDLCDDPSHPRSSGCFGDPGAQCSHKPEQSGVHLGWGHRDRARTGELAKPHNW